MFAVANLYTRWRCTLPARTKSICFFLWLIFPKLCPFWRVSGSRASTWAPTSAMRNDLKLNTRYMSKCCSSQRGRSWVGKRKREREGERWRLLLFNRSDIVSYWSDSISFIDDLDIGDSLNHKNVAYKIPSQKLKNKNGKWFYNFKRFFSLKATHRKTGKLSK